MQNEEQRKLDHALGEIFKNPSRSEDLVTRLRKSVVPFLVVKIAVQENYDFYRSIRTPSQPKGIKVIKTNKTGPLI